MNKSKTVGPRSSGLNNVTLLVAISKSNLVANNKSKIVGPPSSGLNVMLRTGTAKSKPDAISKNKLDANKSNHAAISKNKHVGPPNNGLNVMLRTERAKNKLDAISKSRHVALNRKHNKTRPGKPNRKKHDALSKTKPDALSRKKRVAPSKSARENKPPNVLVSKRLSGKLRKEKRNVKRQPANRNYICLT